MKLAETSFAALALSLEVEDTLRKIGEPPLVLGPLPGDSNRLLKLGVVVVAHQAKISRHVQLTLPSGLVYIFDQVMDVGDRVSVRCLSISAIIHVKARPLPRYPDI